MMTPVARAGSRPVAGFAGHSCILLTARHAARLVENVGTPERLGGCRNTGSCVRANAGFSPMSDSPGLDPKRKAALQSEPA